jgi:hypothetical protein
MSRRSARFLVATLFFSWLILGATSLAYAGYEGTATPAPFACEQCHTPPDETTDYGPHGSFVSSSNKCATCHTVHAAKGAYALLPGPTVKATCELCHDGTGGGGVYGALAARGVPVLGSHRVDYTNVVPGGSAITGQETTRTFVGDDGFLGCDDCHSPHGANTVAVFQGERYRGSSGLNFWPQDYYPDTDPTSKLLKKRPTGATADVAEYGSDWCAACHAGRTSGSVVHNHPADSKQTAASPFDYNHVAVLDSGLRTTGTILRSVTDGTSASGWAMDNRAFLMPDPRTPQQAGHYPICQQCHEDARDVGTLTAAGGLAAPMVVTPDQTSQYPVTDNPRFQNFPHETANLKMLVETNDDLCTNCHVADYLP